MRLREPARIAHDVAALELVVPAVSLDARRPQPVEGPPLPTARGSQPTAMAKPSATSAPWFAAMLSTTFASIMTTSFGAPAASRTREPGARFDAVRLLAVVATTRSVPSHHAETAI